MADRKIAPKPRQRQHEAGRKEVVLDTTQNVYWRCICGQWNKNFETMCHICGRLKGETNGRS